MRRFRNNYYSCLFPELVIALLVPAAVLYPIYQLLCLLVLLLLLPFAMLYYISWKILAFLEHATFLYRTSESENAFPKFQLYLDATKWATVSVLDASMMLLNLSMYATDFEDKFYLKVAAIVNFEAAGADVI
ncbi:hypothetical protein Tco_1081402, partial [Tanacetum coccineum]